MANKFHQMKKSIAWFLLICFLILLIPLWIIKDRGKTKMIADQELHLNIQKTAALFPPSNATVLHLARVSASSLDENGIPFQVVSTLFPAMPYLSQISYIELDGLFFAYYAEGGRLYAVYSNSTYGGMNYNWYTQPVSQDTGRLYGDAIQIPPSDVVNASWFLGALNSTNNGYASVGKGWGSSQDILLLNSAGVVGRSVVSLGLSMKPVIEYMVAQVGFHNGRLYVATKFGNNVLHGGISNIRAILIGNQVSLLRNGDRFGLARNVSCGTTNTGSVLIIQGMKYHISCSFVEIGGLQLFYVLALPHNESSRIIHSNIVVILMIVAMICILLYLAFKAGRTKSMNKNLAFARAIHDIRANLVGVHGLAEMCRTSKREALPTETLTNLQLIESCSSDCLVILNSILDTTKIEAGKMQLMQEDFDMEQLLEDVVDLFHPVGMKKGVDVILDPSDSSITKYSCVNGDRGKLKQILTNLVSNAVKFTSEGYVIIRASARKPRLGNEILSKNDSLSCLLCLIIERSYIEPEHVNYIRGDPNRVEFIFEVSDTGKGIPKEQRKSVFENYVQVKESAVGQEGTGLGLGIVQSLVRLMGGEVRIVDKNVGERGTCFRFNVFLSTSGVPVADTSSRVHDIEADNQLGDSYRLSGPMIRTVGPRTNRSQVILFIQSSKRSKVLQDFMVRQGIKVHVVKEHEQISKTLKSVSYKLLVSHSSSSKSDGPFILIVIDTSGGSFEETWRAVIDFRRDLNDKCSSRVVWLQNMNFAGVYEDKIPPSDLVISKPLHGSRLHKIIMLLPELGGMLPGKEDNDVVLRHTSNRGATTSSNEHNNNEIQELGHSNNRKPLMGKKILVVDDDLVGRRIATHVGLQLGADMISCENGEEAWRMVCMKVVSLDCILMDCQMPVMNGIEAACRIREVEQNSGMHTPIVALTAHQRGEEIDKMIAAGVDAYITKPLNKENFLRVMSDINVCN